MVIAVSTDKVNRSIADVRGVVKDCGAKLADPGSILFKFRRARVVNVKVIDADKDQILGIALDAGAEDVIEPTVYDDDSEEDHSERFCFSPLRKDTLRKYLLLIACFPKYLAHNWMCPNILST